ncbi:hypothetical protein [Deinococcus peraridilitoris]|uniref:hypothetical protein n=1 Tax=Deinococcus peraridilitoris TaxID=432329 RepID=UPI0002EF4D56|nr:hypothetical protein [Deinococcus peraridilitoris]
MKKPLIAGLLATTLASCGGAPAPTYPYNPNMNTVEQNSTLVPYYGDWVIVASLNDGTRRYGVASFSSKYKSTTYVNASGGVMAWCYSQSCSTDSEQGAGIMGTLKTSSGSALASGMVPFSDSSVPRGSSPTRFFMTDLDGKVEVVNKQAVIAGKGLWTNETGTDQAAGFAFVQVETSPSIRPQATPSAAYLTAQTAAQQALTEARLSAQSSLSPDVVRAAITDATR